MYDKMQSHDKKMATDLVDALLAKGCKVSVHDGEDWACKRTTNPFCDAIVQQVESTNPMIGE